ncbi:MAG: PP0621 family protein [Proteobacteria bacterium]|nr:PP0621 family protein [Pseudomonadota bacterium]
MSRLIFLFAIAAVVYLLLKSYRSNITDKKQEFTEDMVRCAHCGLHLPKGESIRAGEQYFCSAAHRDARQG